MIKTVVSVSEMGSLIAVHNLSVAAAEYAFKASQNKALFERIGQFCCIRASWLFRHCKDPLLNMIGLFYKPSFFLSN